MSQHSGPATLPRGFRYPALKTPEPSDDAEETRIPPPPKPRLRLKRRNVSHHQLSAPTQQFLASVAAADIPIPSIEEPEIVLGPPNVADMPSLASAIDSVPPGEGHLPLCHPSSRRLTAAPPATTLDTYSPHLLAPRGRAFSPPKTPVPVSAPSLSPPRYPDWTIDSAISSSVESTPDCDSSRPSTSRSTQTSASLFSRLSHLSDDDQCGSPEIFGEDKFILRQDDSLPPGFDTPAARNRPRKAPWTKAMTTHLWSTYLLYLQDPKVTPFRMGPSRVPPQGVCLRVAREAKRSWKGSRATKKTTKTTDPGNGKKSGSSTPTAESSGVFVEWPHTCAATRAHLRELCKLKATSGSQSRHLLSRSPTPFSQAAVRHWNRRSTPARPQGSGVTRDISMSLAMSTSDSMQPDGPLAQLAQSATPEPPTAAPNNNTFPSFERQGLAPEIVAATPNETVTTSVEPGRVLGRFEGEPSFAERRRLGSPLGARSYGPSSSNSLATAFGLSGTVPRRQTHTMGPARRTLQSPVRLSRAGTQRRRNTQCGVPRNRPSLMSDLWSDPHANGTPQSVIVPVPQQSRAVPPKLDLDALFIPRAPPSLPQPHLATSTSMPDVGTQAPLPLAPPPRLGSPFSGVDSSFSFPRRMHRHHPESVDLGMLGRPFATVRQASEVDAAGSVRADLTGRLAYIDQRLKEFRNRDIQRRSKSPGPH